MTDIDTPYTMTTLELGPMENLVYLICDQATKKTAVVDPAWESKAIIETAKQHAMTITDILLTHSHYDHINGIADIQNCYDAQLHLLKTEAQFWGQSLHKPNYHHGGDSMTLGKTEIKLLHTPGHTPGSCCYSLGNQADIITGDTLFIFGCGRCDLKGGDPEQMYQTLQKMSQQLPDTMKIYPGHHYAEHKTSTLAEQKQGNPFMLIAQLQDFIRYRMQYHDKHREYPYQAETCDDLTAHGFHCANGE